MNDYSVDVGFINKEVFYFLVTVFTLLKTAISKVIYVFVSNIELFLEKF